jgi:hypothetical protein
MMIKCVLNFKSKRSIKEKKKNQNLPICVVVRNNWGIHFTTANFGTLSKDDFFKFPMKFMAQDNTKDEYKKRYSKCTNIFNYEKQF